MSVNYELNQAIVTRLYELLKENGFPDENEFHLWGGAKFQEMRSIFALAETSVKAAEKAQAEQGKYWEQARALSKTTFPATGITGAAAPIPFQGGNGF